MGQKAVTLEAEGVSLIPLTAAHVDAYLQLANEPSIVERINNPLPYAREHFDLLLVDLAAKERFFVWMIMHQGMICGAINTASQGHKEKFQGGYWVDPAHRGKGIAVKALKRANDFLLDNMHATRIQAVVEPDNIASIRVLEKTGYEREALLKKYYPTRRRGLVDVCMYAIVKEGV